MRGRSSQLVGQSISHCPCVAFVTSCCANTSVRSRRPAQSHSVTCATEFGILDYTGVVMSVVVMVIVSRNIFYGNYAFFISSDSGKLTQYYYKSRNCDVTSLLFFRSIHQAPFRLWDTQGQVGLLPFCCFRLFYFFLLNTYNECESQLLFSVPSFVAFVVVFGSQDVNSIMALQQSTC